MFRINYWSNSSFALFLLKLAKIDKPAHGTMQQWADWKKTAKQKNYFIYWFTQKFLNKFQDTIYYIPDKLSSFLAYYKNRFVYKLHYLPTNLKPGTYYEVDYRLEHGLFELFCDFIESEKAYHYKIINELADSKTYFLTNLFKPFKSAQLGIESLKKESLDTYNGELTPQAQSALDQLYLYYWWRQVYASRVDSYLLARQNSYHADYFNLAKLLFDNNSNNNLSKEDKSSIKKDVEKQRKIDYLYKLEEDFMLQRLIKLRHSLWT